MARLSDAIPTFRFDSAEHLCEDAFGQLTAGAASSKHPLHLVGVSTVRSDGAPDARTVVVRGFDPASRLSSFHADIRSPKIAALRRDPRVLLLFYDPATKLQLRMAATATLHHNDARAEAGWIAAAPLSRVLYAQPFASGETLGDGSPWEAPAEVSADDSLAKSRFVWVDCEFRTLDVLWLDSAGHKRAVLSWDAEGGRSMRRIWP